MNYVHYFSFVSTIQAHARQTPKQQKMLLFTISIHKLDFCCLRTIAKSLKYLASNYNIVIDKLVYNLLGQAGMFKMIVLTIILCVKQRNYKRTKIEMACWIYWVLLCLCTKKMSILVIYLSCQEKTLNTINNTDKNLIQNTKQVICICRPSRNACN